MIWSEQPESSHFSSCCFFCPFVFCFFPHFVVLRCQFPHPSSFQFFIVFLLVILLSASFMFIFKRFIFLYRYRCFLILRNCCKTFIYSCTLSPYLPPPFCSCQFQFLYVLYKDSTHHFLQIVFRCVLQTFVPTHLSFLSLSVHVNKPSPEERIFISYLQRVFLPLQII
jgi:hypothetical protein